MKLTQQDAQVILKEAYRLKALHKDSSARLGQSLWWCSSVEQRVELEDDIKFNLFVLLSHLAREGIDFYYEPDDNKTLDMFYKHFVEN